MFEGSRLSYVVPGYTGHIPNKINMQQPAEIEKQEPKYQIPGYAGYIPSIKSENMFAKSYGKLTYSINAGTHHKGQDVEPQQRYTSLLQSEFVDQKLVQQRTAAEIVGVKPQPQVFKNPLPFESINNFFGVPQSEQQKEAINKYQTQIDQILKKEYQQQQQSEEDKFKQSYEDFYGTSDEKEPIKLGTPLPGYTGTTRRVYASNLFGETFANSLKTASKDQKQIENSKMNNFKTQSQLIPHFQK